MSEKLKRISTYDFIEKLERGGLLQEGVRSGVVNPILATQKKVYEFYLLEVKKSGKPRQSVMRTADRFRYSDRWVYGIIKKMKG